MVSGVETEVLRVVGTSLIDSRLDLSQAAFNGELQRPAECLREPQEVAGTSNLGKMAYTRRLEMSSPHLFVLLFG